MTRVGANGGACGFDAIIEVVRIDRDTVRVTIDSECEQITAMNPDLTILNWRRGVFCRMCESRVYQSASHHINHTACPIPAAILKAIEVEVGIALPEDVSISFQT
ncbi:MAG: hypothetical protein HY675_23670 [Chloroflexi bacterium]|nr:hypothetical protein [Chloroflexota bacterium]